VAVAAAKRFEIVPFGAPAPANAAGCDGLVPRCAIDLSHWEGNATPRELMADTSTAIALNFARGGGAIDVATNNHFDTDGALTVYALVRSDVALANADLLIAAAEVGDFDEWPAEGGAKLGERGIKLEAGVRRLAQLRTEAEAYARIVAELEDVIATLDAREDLWGETWRAIERGRAAVARGDVEITIAGEIATLVHRRATSEIPGPALARAIGERAAAGARPTRWLLAFERDDGAWDYRYELLRHAWADTVVRPALASPGKNATAARLCRALGTPRDVWALKNDLGMTGIVRTATPIACDPEAVTRALSRA
jgi:hypothetical protein